jgi:hypothetical protein
MPTTKPALVLRGTFFDRSVSTSEIQSIRSTFNPSDVNSTWGKFKDWLFGTPKEEAMRTLYHLTRPHIYIENNSNYVANRFFALRKLASKHCKKQFTVVFEGDDVILMIARTNISINLSQAKLTEDILCIFDIISRGFECETTFRKRCDHLRDNGFEDVSNTPLPPLPAQIHKALTLSPYRRYSYNVSDTYRDYYSYSDTYRDDYNDGYN